MIRAYAELWDSEFGGGNRGRLAVHRRTGRRKTHTRGRRGMTRLLTLAEYALLVGLLALLAARSFMLF